MSTAHLLPGCGRWVKVQALAACPIAGVCYCQAYQASSTREARLGPSRLVEAYPLRPVSTVHYSRPLHCSFVLSRSRFRMHAGIMRKPNRPRRCTLIACFCRQPASSGVNPKTILAGFRGYRRQRLAASSRLPMARANGAKHLRPLDSFERRTASSRGFQLQAAQDLGLSRAVRGSPGLLMPVSAKAPHRAPPSRLSISHGLIRAQAIHTHAHTTHAPAQHPQIHADTRSRASFNTPSRAGHHSHMLGCQSWKWSVASAPHSSPQTTSPK